MQQDGGKPEDLREDQIEALLALINGYLEVTHEEERTPKYYASIKLPKDESVGVFGVEGTTVTFVGSADTRIDAVRNAWEQCMDFARRYDSLQFLVGFKNYL